MSKRICSIEGCETQHKGKGYCLKHLRRFNQYGDPLKGGRATKGVCSVSGCMGTHAARGYCSMHYQRLKNGTGDMGAEPLYAPKGSGTINEGGYRVIRVEKQQVLEHRYVMEQALGRPLFADENVHHINGDRADNRLENLELWSTSQPAGQRVEDKVEWAEMILTRYGRLGSTPTTRA